MRTGPSRRGGDRAILNCVKPEYPRFLHNRTTVDGATPARSASSATDSSATVSGALNTQSAIARSALDKTAYLFFKTVMLLTIFITIE